MTEIRDDQLEEGGGREHLLPHEEIERPTNVVQSDLSTSSMAVAGDGADMALVYASGVELKARSQWGYAMRRFFRHRLAMAGLVGFLFICLVAIFAEQIAPYPYDELDFNALRIPPTTEGQRSKMVAVVAPVAPVRWSSRRSRPARTGAGSSSSSPGSGRQPRTPVTTGAPPSSCAPRGRGREPTPAGARRRS